MSVTGKLSGPVDCTVAPSLETLKGKSVIVTGGSSGLGAAYVSAFLSAGAYVTNADINPDENTKHDQYQYVLCDVRSWADQLSVFKAAMTNSPNHNVDIVIANAGVVGSDPLFVLEDTDDPSEPDLKIISTNYMGAAYTTKLALHYFAKSGVSDKCLILISSMAGYLDLPGAPSYQSSKFAVRGLMCNLRRTDLCRVNLIAPGFIATPIMIEPVVKMLTAKLHELGSDWGLMEDAVKAVLRIATDGSINGRSLAIVARIIRKEGYLDLERDVNEAGGEWERWQNVSLKMTHRSAPPKM